MTLLSDLADKYGTDKRFADHNYVDMYEQLMESKRMTTNKMLEIGFDKFSLKNSTLKTVINSGVLNDFVYNDLVNETPLKMCKTICGKY